VKYTKYKTAKKLSNIKRYAKQENRKRERKDKKFGDRFLRALGIK
jgi:hypothetical protein